MSWTKGTTNMTTSIDMKDFGTTGASSTDPGVTLSFHDIHYEVMQKLDDVPICGKKQAKEILCGVSGYLPPGLNAIMGPTGSGKTSLLDVLAQRKEPKGLTGGKVLINGEKLPHDFRLMSGYVVQDDIVMGTLTVRENIAFSANLRLDNEKYTQDERNKKVDYVIEELGLQACADTPVGNEFVRGVSGGERKRVNIGMELILDPPVLFLDEPTTGLDANTANTIVLLLYKIASGGRNIIMSIHQPRYSIYALFDRLIILNKGDIVYRGPAQTAVNYFEEIGYKCPQYHNPPDYFLDIVGGDVNTAQLLNRLTHKQQANKDNTTTTKKEITMAMNADERTNNAQKLIESFVNSNLCREEMKQVKELDSCPDSASDRVSIKSTSFLSGCTNKAGMDVEYVNSFATQSKAVVQRTVRNLIRNPMTSTIQLFIQIFMGALIGVIYWQIDLGPNAIQDRAGIFFFLITSQVMSNLSALQVFIENRKFFIHESSSGYYRASVFFIAQVCADLLPNRVLPNLVFCTMIYFMCGFQLVASKYFVFLLTMILTAISASTIAFFVSASVGLFAVANALVSLPYILMMLFGGFLVNIESILPWLAWLKYFSIFRYGINAISINEMEGLVFDKINGTIPPPVPTGEIYLEAQGIRYDSWGLWQNIVALIAIAVGFLILAYIQLRRINKYK